MTDVAGGAFRALVILVVRVLCVVRVCLQAGR